MRARLLALTPLLLVLAAFVAIAITAVMVSSTSSTRRTADASTPCPGADATPAICVSDATAPVSDNVTVSIHFYQVPAAGQTGYGFNMKYPAGLTMVAAGTSNSCIDGEGGVPPSNGPGAGPKTYSAGCTNLPSPGTPFKDCGGAGGCTLATVVFTCTADGTFTLDLQGASATRGPAYADDTGSTVLIGAANTHNGIVICGGGIQATNTPTSTVTPAPTETPTVQPTPCVGVCPTPTATSTVTPAPTETPTPQPTPCVGICPPPTPTSLPSGGYPPPTGNCSMAIKTTAAVGDSVAITVTVRDATGKLVVGANVAFSVLLQPGADATVTADAAPTDALGVATGMLAVGSVPGVVQVRATAPTVSCSGSIVVGSTG